MSGWPKTALKDPERWVGELAERLGDGPLARELRGRAAALAPQARRIASLREERGRTSRAIGEARARGADAAPLLDAMRAIGAKSGELEGELREGLDAIAALVAAAAETEEAPTPADAASERGGAPAYFAQVARAGLVPAAGYGAALSVSVVDGASAAADYSCYVRAHPARTAYHELELGALIAETLGQSSRYLLARDASGAVRGALPLVRLESRLFGDYVVSMPWFNYGGPLADDEATCAALLQAAAGFARERGCSHMEIRETRPRPGWLARTHKVSMTLALPAEVDALERSFGASVRAQADKAARAGCTFRTGERELLDDFYHLYCVRMRELGTPVQSRAFFENLLELFGKDAFLAVVARDGRALAAGFFLAHGDTLEVPWASSLRRANPLGVNMLLYRRALCEAVARGYRHFDFGRSSEGSPTWRFKRQWGAVPRQLYWHYWTAAELEPPGPSADDPKFLLASALWRRLPLRLTRRLGPAIVRGLP